MNDGKLAAIDHTVMLVRNPDEATNSSKPPGYVMQDPVTQQTSIQIELPTHNPHACIEPSLSC